MRGAEQLVPVAVPSYAFCVIRVAWVVAAALVPAGIITYFVWQTSWAWFLGLLMVTPFAYLAVRRASKRGYGGKTHDGDGGVWGSP